MLPEMWQGARRVLVLRLDNVGDVVMLSPALRAIRHNLPDAHITLMASPAGTQVAPLLPWLDDVLTYRPVWQDVGNRFALDPARELALVEILRAGDYDVAIIFTSFSQSPYPPAYACYLAGIPIRLGQSKEFGGSVLSQWVKSLPDDAHQTDRSLHLLAEAGFDLTGHDLELRVPDAVQTEADAILHAVGVDPFENFVIIAPGASCAARRYDPQRYAAVARLLLTETPMPVVVVGSDKEADVAAPLLALRDSRIVSLVGRTDIPQLAAVIRRARLVLCNDSGPMHIADAFQRPQVVTYSGTEYETQWQPRTGPATILRRPTPCSPCYAFQCPFHMECLDIPPAEVAAAALDMVKKTEALCAAYAS